MQTKKVPTFFEKNLEKLNNNILKIYNEILDSIFPPVCGVCGKINRNWLCDNCKNRIDKLEESIDIDIQLSKVHFEKLIYIFKYKGLIRKLILKYKFNDCAYLYNFFGAIILNKEKYCRILKSYDIIIPVPMYEKKKAERGYNQTELISKEIALKLDIKLGKNVVQKVKNTKVQSTLSREERKQNIKNAFSVNNKEDIINKRVIIFDDIYTTGETVNELSRVLKESGAKEILIFVLAKD